MNLMNPTKMKNADSGRTNRAMFNSFFAVGSYALLMISNFITRKVFNDQLGLELSGVENQFKSVISMLSLAELGIGTGLVYLLYKPILDNDRSAIRRILNFYQSAYRVIAVIIASFGVVLSFFNHRLFENNTYNPVYFGIIFFLFTCDTLAAYLFANQRALIIADQKNYVNNINEMIMVLMTTVLQVTLLIALPKKYLLQNFLIYVIVKVACRVAAALLIHRNFRRLYPDIAADRDRTSISREERQSVLKNIRAMLFHKIGGFGITASGNVIIPALLGAIYNGVYGNYMLIVITLNQLVSQVFGGITASFGNFLNSGDISASFKKFKELYHLNFLLVSLFTTGTFVLMSVLVEVVGGPGSVLPSYAAVLLSVYFFVNTMRRVIFMVRDSAGLYRPDRYMPLVEFAINVGVSILLVTQTGLGVVGVVIGGLVSMLVIPFWIQPIIVYRDVFKQRPGGYFVRYGVYALATAASCLVTMAAADRIAPVYSG
ncbi:MAG: hypothetical protein FWE80_07160, partial [Oscillospiraceae bacterium]|nr:hypothetical protein [Oscillospiraceae bacterium]